VILSPVRLRWRKLPDQRIGFRSSLLVAHAGGICASAISIGFLEGLLEVYLKVNFRGQLAGVVKPSDDADKDTAF